MPTPAGYPFLSGFCSNNQCEGTRPKSFRGEPLKVCINQTYCECECHVKLDKMFELAGMPRTPQENPEYVAPVRTFWMPRDEPDYGLPEAAPELDNEGSVAVADREVKATLTGRTQRGGLEYWVQRECLAWVVDQDPSVCGPRYLSEEIARVEGIKPPSQGAIAAVFDRWTEYGYAIIERKPVRFVGLTEQGKEKGLDWCRANFKASKKKK